jgi:hypothetical protein
MTLLVCNNVSVGCNSVDLSVFTNHRPCLSISKRQPYAKNTLRSITLHRDKAVVVMQLRENVGEMVSHATIMCLVC